MLGFLDSFLQTFYRVIRMNRYSFLSNDSTGIDFFLKCGSTTYLKQPISYSSAHACGGGGGSGSPTPAVLTSIPINRRLKISSLTTTKWTVQPLSLTPALRTSRWACMPLKDGNNDGCVLSILPFHFFTNSPVNILMNPAKHTISTQDFSKALWIAMSKSFLARKFLWFMTLEESGHAKN